MVIWTYESSRSCCYSIRATYYFFVSRHVCKYDACRYCYGLVRALKVATYVVANCIQQVGQIYCKQILNHLLENSLLSIIVVLLNNEALVVAQERKLHCYLCIIDTLSALNDTTAYSTHNICYYLNAIICNIVVKDYCLFQMLCAHTCACHYLQVPQLFSLQYVLYMSSVRLLPSCRFTIVKHMLQTRSNRLTSILLLIYLHNVILDYLHSVYILRACIYFVFGIQQKPRIRGSAHTQENSYIESTAYMQ